MRALFPWLGCAHQSTIGRVKPKRKKKKWEGKRPRESFDSLWFLLTRAICPSHHALQLVCNVCTNFVWRATENSWNLCSTHDITPQSTRRQSCSGYSTPCTDADFGRLCCRHRSRLLALVQRSQFPHIHTSHVAIHFVNTARGMNDTWKSANSILLFSIDLYPFCKQTMSLPCSTAISSSLHCYYCSCCCYWCRLSFMIHMKSVTQTIFWTLNLLHVILMIEWLKCWALVCCTCATYFQLDWLTFWSYLR